MKLELIDKGRTINGKTDKPLKMETTLKKASKVLGMSSIDILYTLRRDNLIETEDCILYGTFKKGKGVV